LIATRFETMAYRNPAVGKNAESKLEAAHGGLTGDPRHQITGKAR
jgi:hypothetical protein